MRVFITGASGFIGQVVVPELLKHGHTIIALARSDASAEALTKAGAEVQRGVLTDLESLKQGAASADAVIHLAFDHDFSDLAKSIRNDTAAIEAMGEVMAGGQPLIIASGTLATSNGQLANEDTGPVRDDTMALRAKSANAVYRLSKEKQIRGAVVRLPPTVHGAGDHSLIPQYIDMARKKGVAIYISDPLARWPACHRQDAATLFRLVLEKGQGGRTYNAIAEQGVPLKDVMTLIGKQLRVPVEAKSQQEAFEVLGFWSSLIAMDNPTSSERTQRELDWHPTQIELLEDMEANYFAQELDPKHKLW